jgi:AraC family transcriptional regulator
LEPTSGADPEAYGAEASGGFGTEKYGADGLLASSMGKGWNGLTAALFRHGNGVLSWKNAQPDTEICVDLRGNRSVVTRTGGGILDRTVAERGTIWMSPAGLQEDLLEISDPMPSVLHIYLPSSHFSPEGLGVEVDSLTITSLRFERSFQDPLLAEISYAIASELHSQTSAGRLLIETLASSLSARLLQNYVSRSPAQAVPSVPQEGLDRRRLARVMDYIEANLEGDLTLDELASIACLSRFHFARAFKAAVGRPPHQYVSAKRLERAKSLLTQGDRPLVDIALALNFSSQANFSRAFRQLTGQAPGQFRRNPV